MLSHIAKRVLLLMPILLVVSMVVFLLLRLGKGDPAMAYLRLSQIPRTDQALAEARRTLGLERPLGIIGAWRAQAPSTWMAGSAACAIESSLIKATTPQRSRQDRVRMRHLGSKSRRSWRMSASGVSNEMASRRRPSGSITKVVAE